MHWISLGKWLLICFAVAGIGGASTAREVKSWYPTLLRPGFSPPDWVFGPVWTLLYAMMTVAVWQVSLTPDSPQRTRGIILFLIQLALNLGWTWLFFARHLIGRALVEIVVLWLMILATILVFWRVSPLAAALLVPYLMWVSFATLLNAGFWRLNRERKS